MNEQQSNALTTSHELYKYKRENKLLTNEVNRLEKEILHMRQSFSWRITSPFRAIRIIIRKTFTLFKLLYKNIRLEGGMKNFSALSLQQIKKSGWKNFLQNFRNAHIAHGIDYQFWVQKYDTVTPEIEQKIQHYIDNQLEIKPLISIVIPVYNPDINLLKECLQSVTDQLYSNWEICLANDASTDSQVKLLLDQYVSSNPKIKVVHREENGHISAATNSGISISTGEYIAFLDQDDLLTKDALFWVAHTINQHPDLAIFYSDEDKLDLNGKRCEPHFKSDYNTELLFGYNYFNHLTVMKKSLIEKVGGLREGFEGAQDHDLILRSLSYIKPEQIIHLPKILYHWRMLKGGTALSIEEKPYIKEAGEKTLNEHFQRNHINAIVQFNPNISAFETHFLPKGNPLISIIIPTKNTHELVVQCIESIYQKTLYQNFEIILINNNSDDALSLKIFQELKDKYAPTFTIINDSTSPFNYSKINNNAAKVANGDFLLFLNNDIEVINSEWLHEMLGIAEQDNVGAVGAKLYYENNTIQHAGVIIGISGTTGVEGVAGHAFRSLPRDSIGYIARSHLPQVYSAVTAACLLIKKETFWDVSGFNETELTVAFNDVDLCLKLQKKGYRNIWTPFAELYHYESISRGSDDESLEKSQRFNKEMDYMRKSWNTNEKGDPYYNPNLSYVEANFRLGEPFFKKLPLDDKRNVLINSGKQ